MQPIGKIRMKNCLICKKEIHRAKSCNTRKTLRGNREVTCSRICSQIYKRVNNYIRGRINREKLRSKR